MTSESPAALIELVGVVKAYGAEQPLRFRDLAVRHRDRLIVSGLDAQAAEMLMHLICGALLPDEGTVRIAGRATSEISTDQQWLQSLDRFGLVTHRAVLIDSLTTMANLALPMTLSIDPMAPTTRAEVDAVGRLVGLSADRMTAAVSSLSPLERLRLHLGRAVIQKPMLVLLEHPTRELTHDEEREAFGRVLTSVADGRGIGWLAVSDDDVFAKAAKGTRLRIDPETGVVAASRGWWPFGRS
jgi:ABC-type lipoprotein export system ATPase subunit